MKTAEEIINEVNLEIMTETGVDITGYSIFHDLAIRCINIARKEIIEEIMDNVNYYVECEDDWRHDVRPIIYNIDKLKNNLI